jgi:glycosyltransferase involved in cell wall biosynthesis
VFVLPEFLPEVDPPEFDADAPREKLIVFLGRLVHEKRADLVPAVVAELRRSDPEWRGVIFGKGPDKENVAAAVDRAGQADSVRLAGLAPWDEVSETMSRASCLVFPTEREGFGLVVLEAASHGLPAVLVDGEDNAAVELIEAHRNGLVCPEPDPGRLAQAVLELSADAGIHARTREWYDAASERLSVPNAVKELLELDDLAGEPSAPAELRT